MKGNFLLGFFIAMHSCLLTAQSTYPLTDSCFIFWQKSNRITSADFKIVPSMQSNPVAPSGALWTVLDLPKDSLLAPAMMRCYIAPVFDRTSSFAGADDSALVAASNIYFDICEVVARTARKRINDLPDSVISSTALSFTFKTIVHEMHETRLRTYRKFYREMFRLKKEGALLAWRHWLDQELDSTEQWATSPAECFRFISGRPVESGYTEDVRSNAKVVGDRNEQVLAPDYWHAGFYQVSRFRYFNKERRN